MEKDAGVRLRIDREIALVPDGALVIEEFGALGVPVGGDLQRGGLRVVVLGGEIVAGLRLAVEEESVLLLLVVKAPESVEVGIDDRVPFAVEREGGAAVGAGERDGCGLRGRKRRGCHEDEKDEARGMHEGLRCVGGTKPLNAADKPCYTSPPEIIGTCLCWPPPLRAAANC